METISIFKNQESEFKYISAYDAVLAHWPVPYAAMKLSTRLGETHIIASGPTNAPPIVLLPGNFDCSLSWFHSVSCLIDAHRVYAIDTMGDVGKSKAYRLPKDRQDYANWLMDVLDGLQVPSADFMGLSYGGFLAVNFALKFKDRARSVILLCPGLPLAPFTFQWIFRGMPMILHPSEATVKWFINGTSTARNYDELIQVFVLGMTGARSTKVLRPVFGEHEWKKLQMPVLLLIGDHEIMYEPAKAIRQAKQWFPNLQTELIRDAGHFLLADQAHQVNQKVLAFLAHIN